MGNNLTLKSWHGTWKSERSEESGKLLSNYDAELDFFNDDIVFLYVCSENGYKLYRVEATLFFTYIPSLKSSFSANQESMYEMKIESQVVPRLKMKAYVKEDQKTFSGTYTNGEDYGVFKVELS